MMSTLIETLLWTAALTITAIHVDWGIAAICGGNLALCLIKTPGIAREEEAQAALDAECDAYWASLRGCGGRS